MDGDGGKEVRFSLLTYPAALCSFEIYLKVISLPLFQGAQWRTTSISVAGHIT